MTIGHNSSHLTRAQKDSLHKFVSAIEDLETQKGEIAEQIKETYAEVKLSGLDAKAVKQMVRERSWDKEKREAHDEAESIRDLYRTALGLA